MRITLASLILFCLGLPALAAPPAAAAPAAQPAPWGKGQVMAVEYAPAKVVYDVSTDSVRVLEGVLDRASYLSQIYNADPFDASIVLVLHGPEINFFARRNTAQYRALMERAHSLTVGGVIQIRMCKIAAQGQGYAPQDIHGFVQLVPMGDAEIVRLQTAEGYAYMR